MFEELIDKLCCPPAEASCFITPCDDDYKSDDYGLAGFIAKGDFVLPRVGDVGFNTNLFVNDGDTGQVLVAVTTDNYWQVLNIWARKMQYTCGGGKNAKVIWLKENTVQFKTTEPEMKYSAESLGRQEPYIIGARWELTAMLLHSFANCAAWNGFAKSSYLGKLSIVMFTNKHIFVYDSANGVTVSTDKVVPIPALAATKSRIASGMANFKVNSDDVTLCPVAVPKASLPAYDAYIKSDIEFTFGITKPFIQTGLVEQTCGRNSLCLNYETTAATPFTFQWLPQQAATCLQANLFENCNEVLTAKDILIDSETGLVTSTGLAAGNYRFDVVYENECCILGKYCIQITVKP